MSVNNPTWNIMAAVLNREYGFSPRHPDPFQKDCYTSKYILSRIQVSHQLLRGIALVINFNFSGDLLCAGFFNSRYQRSSVALLDWASRSIRTIIETENTRITDANFLIAKNYRDGLDVISVHENGILRLDTVNPAGAVTTTRTQNLSNERHKLAICPRNPNEILSASITANIYSIDRRSPPWSPTLWAMEKPPVQILNLHAIAHHPFAPQICCSYSDYHVRIYDKRRFNHPLHEISPRVLHDANSFAKFSDCLYSYDGSEILATYTGENTFLFDSENVRNGTYKQSYVLGGGRNTYINRIAFFGPKSEFVVAGDKKQRIGFFDKVTGSKENELSTRPIGCFKKVHFLALKSHPHLPIVVASVNISGLSVLMPSSKKLPFTE